MYARAREAGRKLSCLILLENIRMVADKTAEEFLRAAFYWQLGRF
jgi:hypothetical protein